VTCLLKARIAEPEEMAVAKQWLCKRISTVTNHVTEATHIHATTEKLLEVVFSVGSMQRLYQDSVQANRPVQV
jgi:hypothetical protein